MSDALIEIACVRLALLCARPARKTPESWLRYADVGSDGAVTFQGKELVRNLLVTAGLGGQIGELDQIRSERYAMVYRQPHRWVRGHDFILLLQKVLKSSWGRRRGGSWVSKSEDQLARLLMLSVPTDSLDEAPLFRQLHARFAS